MTFNPALLQRPGRRSGGGGSSPPPDEYGTVSLFNFWNKSHDPTAWQIPWNVLLTGEPLWEGGVDCLRFRDTNNGADFYRIMRRIQQGQPRYADPGYQWGWVKNVAGNPWLAFQTWDGANSQISYVNTETGVLGAVNANHDLQVRESELWPGEGIYWYTFQYLTPARNVNGMIEFYLAHATADGTAQGPGNGAQEKLIFCPGWNWHSDLGVPQENPEEWGRVHGAVLDTDAIVVVADGNGISEQVWLGGVEQDGILAYPFVLANNLTNLPAFGDFEVIHEGFMFAVSGGSLSLLPGHLPYQGSALKTRENRTVVVVLGFHNGTALAEVEAYGEALAAVGLFSIVVTFLNTYVMDGTALAALAADNATLLGNTDYSAVLNLTADIRFAHGNSTYRDNGVELTPAGHALLAELLQPIVLDLLGLG